MRTWSPQRSPNTGRADACWSGRDDDYNDGSPTSRFHFDVAKQEWDVVIIGAGPAGAFAANLLARMSLKALLVESSCFRGTKCAAVASTTLPFRFWKKLGWAEYGPTCHPTKSTEFVFSVAATPLVSHCHADVPFHAELSTRRWWPLQPKKGPISWTALRRRCFRDCRRAASVSPRLTGLTRQVYFKLACKVLRGTCKPLPLLGVLVRDA